MSGEGHGIVWGDIVYEVMQLAGILAFAISGALVGVRRNLDLLGVIVVGLATGLGGGIIRDMLLGVHPPVSFVHWPNFAVAAAGSLAVFLFHPTLSRIRRFEIMFDAFGLGLFSASVSAAAMDNEQGPLTAVIVGVLTAVGGGVIRDVLVNHVPAVLTRELYAVSALAGSLIVVIVMLSGGAAIAASLLGGAVAVTLRLLSVAYGWHLPRPRLSERED
ncbi:trimeric intracellular cation channel family protein [Leucobacter sp. GX24907]